MIRTIPVEQLRTGMYIVDLHCAWLDHGFWRPRFPVRDEATLRRIASAGIARVSIDTQRGLDVEVSVERPFEKPMPSLAERIKTRPVEVSLEEERRRAARLLNEANHTVLELMEGVRRGVNVDALRLEPVVEKLIESVRRNPDALVPLARLKQRDHYSGEHAVATAALMVALGQHLDIGRREMERLALGALVKDVGELALEGEPTAKSGRLSEGEQRVMRRHVEESLAVLDAPSRLGETAVAVILEHHERYDGSGYPYRRAGEAISLAGRMAAVTDAYDAMTSDRPYRGALSPAAALRQIYNGSGRQFDPELVAGLVHTLGVYPVGTLVKMEGGHLAIVERQNAGHPLEPFVKVIYHAPRRQYVEPVLVDLSRRFGNHYGRIVQAEAYERWGISPLRWQPA